NSKEADNPVQCLEIHRGNPVDISELQAFLELVEGTTLFTRKPEAPSESGGGTQAGDTGPVDVGTEIELMNAGKSVNAVHCRIVPSLLYTEHPDDVLNIVVEETMKMAEAKGLAWDRKREVTTVSARIVSAYNMMLRDYDPGTGVIPVWLPADFHAPWIERLQRRDHPEISRNAQGFYVRSKYKPAS